LFLQPTSYLFTRVAGQEVLFFDLRVYGSRREVVFISTYEFARGNERFCFAFLCACRGGSRNKLVRDFLSQFVCDLRCTVIAVSRISFSRTRYSFSAINKIKSRAIFILFFCSSNSHLPATAVDVCCARKTNVVAFFVTAGTLQFVEPILSPSITSGFLIRLLFLSLFRLELFLAQNCGSRIVELFLNWSIFL